MKPGPLAPAVPALWALAGLAVSLDLLPATVWVIAGVGLAAAATFDLAAVLLTAAPEMQRILPATLALGARTPVTVRLRNQSRGACRLEVHDHHPVTFDTSGLPARLTVPPGATTDLRYWVTPRLRGEAHFQPTAAWMRSPGALWQRKVRGGRSDAGGAGRESVRVYPDFRSISHYNLLASGGHLTQLGIHKRPRRGVGLEFHQLREYRFGDPPSGIDWRATSRSLKLISREYQDEQNQQVVLLLDCGRRMWTRDGQVSHLDRSLNAALLLAHVALKQGDSVGLMTFGGTDNRSLAPRRSVHALDSLLNATYDVTPSLQESDVAEALEQAAAALRKRSLIVLLSNLSDHQPENLATVARSIRARHLMLFASLRETVLDSISETPVTDLATALRYGATQAYLQERERQLHLLRAEGVVCVDVAPSRLPAALASTYFALKAERLL